jgi:hypothetical protein
VIAVPAFLVLAAAHLLGPGPRATGWLAAAAGVVALACMDRVYVAMARDRRPRLDAAAAQLGAAFLAGVLAMVPWLVVAVGLVRLAGFVERLRLRPGPPGAGAWAFALVRVGIGLALPMTAAVTVGPGSLPLAAAAALAGELLDRAAFYDSLDVTTPRARIAADLTRAAV